MYFLVSPPSALIASNISKTAWLAPPCNGPQSADIPAESEANKPAWEDPILEVARGLEQEALNDPYFVERKLYPNVDFYSGIIYRAMDIPVEMFTVMFALGRLPGWIAQWKEMRLKKEPIGRPRQIYIGENERPFVKLEER